MKEREEMANQGNSGGIGGAIVTLIIIGAIWSSFDGDSSSADTTYSDSSYSDTSYTDTSYSDSSYSDSNYSDSSTEITAEMVVDFGFSNKDIRGFCLNYYTIGDYDLALLSFEGGYGAGQDPSAEEVFDELLSHC